MKTKLVLATLAVIGVCGCSGEPQRVELPATADPSQELNTFSADLKSAHDSQIDAESPVNYEKAVKERDLAAEQIAKGKKNDVVLKTIGEGKAYLVNANAMAQESAKRMSDVMGAREKAIQAGSPTYEARDFGKADRELRDMTAKVEKGNMDVNDKDKAKLQARYSAIELSTIELTKLGYANRVIKSAEKADAKKYAPQSLKEAKESYKRGISVIEVDRHNMDEVNKASAEASKAADHVLKITNDARVAKGLSPEQVALGNEIKDQTIATDKTDLRDKTQIIESDNVAISDRDATISEQTEDLAATDTVLLATGDALDKTQDQLDQKTRQADSEKTKNEKLSKEERFNRSFKEASKDLDPAKAEVYRDGDKLLIRLKGLDFPTGTANLRGDSFALLNSVKDVLQKMNAKDLTIEGHTDSVGGKQANQKLSEKRAEAVAQYLESTKVIASEHVETKGYGFAKPVASNKTKEGRSENRRVDLLITPADQTDTQ